MDQLRQVEITIKYPLYQKEFNEKQNENEIVLGWFHGWEDYKTEDFSCKYAIVELESGKIEKFEPTEIKFTGKVLGQDTVSKEAMDDYLNL